MSTYTPIDYLKSATHWFGHGAEELDRAESKALDHVVRREAITEDPLRLIEEQATFGERLADRVATFGGSWTFISIFGAMLLAWATLNTGILGKIAFDPYPYVFLNLILSMLAALQAPIIMMSQNRVSIRDRQMATHDYEVNLKAEIEIMALHEKIDSMRTEQLVAVIAQQQRQVELLMGLVEAVGSPKGK